MKLLVIKLYYQAKLTWLTLGRQKKTRNHPTKTVIKIIFMNIFSAYGMIRRCSSTTVQSNWINRLIKGYDGLFTKLCFKLKDEKYYWTGFGPQDSEELKINVELWVSYSSYLLIRITLHIISFSSPNFEKIDTFLKYFMITSYHWQENVIWQKVTRSIGYINTDCSMVYYLLASVYVAAY